MKDPLPSLDGLKVFEAAARHLSFSEAARELCITKGAVSYQIRRLEQRLDCALFRRSVRQVYLTDAGQKLFHTTQRLFAQLTATLQQMQPGDGRQDIVVGATTYVALRWLSPRIAAFSERHPEVSILLQHSVNSEGFRIQEVDFAIRWCEMQMRPARDRPLQLPMSLFPVCSPRLLDRFDDLGWRGRLAPRQLGEPPLNAIPLLCEDRRTDLWQTWYGNAAIPLTNPRRVIADANVRTQAAVDGQGWTLADALMQPELDAGLLIAPFAHRLKGYGYAMQTAPGRYVSRSAMALRDWLVSNA